ncbi:hypothetical protein SUGI_0302180 [Cryptomeria japonica]|nr:hypothetical protein SUGI_0302180 [Cryptomeria japonica]
MNPPRRRRGKSVGRRGTSKNRLLLLGEGEGGDIDPEEIMQNEVREVAEDEKGKADCRLGDGGAVFVCISSHSIGGAG